MTISDYVKSVERSKVSPSATITLGRRSHESETCTEEWKRKERDRAREREQRDRHTRELARVNLQGR
jgi:hypothetical protein